MGGGVVGRPLRYYCRNTGATSCSFNGSGSEVLDDREASGMPAAIGYETPDGEAAAHHAAPLDSAPTVTPRAAFDRHRDRLVTTLRVRTALPAPAAGVERPAGRLPPP